MDSHLRIGIGSRLTLAVKHRRFQGTAVNIEPPENSRGGLSKRSAKIAD